MGIRSFIDPVPAMCVGTSESNVYEMVSAFSTFANEGVHTDPIFVTRIEDRQGNLIASFIPQSQDAISDDTAYTMLTMLQKVVTNGTASRLRYAYGMEGVELGGKTGTSQKNRDAWFMCVAPKLTMGAWVGGEDQSVHLSSRGEGGVVALPIVGDFLQRVHNDGTLGISRSDMFVRPTNPYRLDCSTEEIQAEFGDEESEDEFFE
jgi:penicillin-binding protein 1A